MYKTFLSEVIPTLSPSHKSGVQSIVLQQHSFSFTHWLEQHVTLDGQGQQKETNVILLCSTSCVMEVLSKVKAIDLELGTLSTLRTSTHWIIAVTSGRLLDLAGLSVTIDNVLVLSPAHVDPISGEVTPTQVYTLMWRRDCRSLDHVTALTNESQPQIENDRRFWPNKHFGFNGRKFIFVTKEDRTVTTEQSLFSVVKNHNINCFEERYQSVEWPSLRHSGHILIETQDGLWGSLTSNVTSGLTGDVRTGKADVGLAQFFIVTDNAKHVDIASPIIYNEMVMVYRKPDARDNWSLLLGPISSVVLWLVFGSLIFVTVFVSALEAVGPCASLVQCGQESPPSLGSRLKSSAAAIFTRVSRLTVGALLAQGSKHVPEAWSSRAAISTWWIFCMIMAIAYSANMAAHLSVTKDQQLFANLRDLVSQSDYKWGVLDSSSIYTMMDKSNLSVYKQVVAGIAEFSKTDPQVLASDDTQHFLKVMREKYVYLAGRRTVEAQTVVNFCQLEVIGGFLWLGDSILLRKHSALTKPFSDAILQIHSSGLMDKLYQRWYPHHRCPDEDGVAGPAVITLSVLQGALYLAGSGLLLSAIFLGFELLYMQCRKTLSYTVK
ncbi:hypothetical protein BaRGS_00032498 [Batillaria attramentaria]|uniref:Ionotropic glutamate receptor C-terminal domain-containing protein n=1 Tax=Batillaria attramentaria TaxID=370345 RepID=A0ABD0JP30_9CAEN